MKAQDAREVKDYLVSRCCKRDRDFTDATYWRQFRRCVRHLEDILDTPSTLEQRQAGTQLAKSLSKGEDQAVDLICKGAMTANATIETLMLSLLLQGDRLIRGVTCCRGRQFQLTADQMTMFNDMEFKLKRKSKKELFDICGLTFRKPKGWFFYDIPSYPILWYFSMDK